MNDLSKPHLLVVDDEEEIRRMLRRHFTFLGYQVTTAGGGREALEVLSRERMEVVITDIMMPGMNGIDLLRVIKQEYPMVHVIMITGYVTLENILAAMRRGADTCVFKPFTDLTELEKAVKRAVEDLRRWQDKMKAIMALRP